MLTEFQKDLRTLTLDEALTKHGLTLKEAFTTLHHQLLYSKKKPQKPLIQYIQETNGRYYVKKQVNGKVRTFGTYTTLTDAKRLRDHCIKHGWKQKQVDNYCKELGIKRETHPLNKARYH